MMCKENNDKKEELILTPGGYRSKSLVKRVGTNEAVVCKEDGTYAIVPRKKPPEENKSKDSQQSIGYIVLKSSSTNLISFLQTEIARSDSSQYSDAYTFTLCRQIICLSVQFRMQVMVTRDPNKHQFSSLCSMRYRNFCFHLTTRSSSSQALIFNKSPKESVIRKINE